MLWNFFEELHFSKNSAEKRTDNLGRGGEGLSEARIMKGWPFKPGIAVSSPGASCNWPIRSSPPLLTNKMARSGSDEQLNRQIWTMCGLPESPLPPAIPDAAIV